MKLSCGIIRDLLPLYEDEVCCEESREQVEEHLAECAECRALLEKFKIPDISLLPEEEILLAEEEKRIRRIFRRLKRRWRLSLAVLLLIIPLVYAGVLLYHEYRGEGLCFTNLDEVMTGSRFFELLQEENYEQAAAMIDFESGYQSLRETLEGDVEEEVRAWYNKYFGDVLSMSEEEYVQKQQDAFVKFMEESHVLILRARYRYAYRTSSEWVVEYTVTERVADMEGSDRIFRVSMGIHDGKLLIGAASSEPRDSELPSFLDIFFRKFE